MDTYLFFDSDSDLDLDASDTEVYDDLLFPNLIDLTTIDEDGICGFNENFDIQ